MLQWYYLGVELRERVGNYTVRKCCGFVKALLTLIPGSSYPHFSAFGTEMATIFSENKVTILLKI